MKLTSQIPSSTSFLDAELLARRREHTTGNQCWPEAYAAAKHRGHQQEHWKGWQDIPKGCFHVRSDPTGVRRVLPQPMTAMIEISGREATRAPKAGLRLAISETSAASRPDNAALIAK